MSYKIYVKKWSEIFIDVELRLKWLNQKLLIERDKLSQETPTDVSTSMELLTTSSAVRAGQVVLPSEI